MSHPRKWSDEQLIKRANYTARNFLVLAILASLWGLLVLGLIGHALAQGTNIKLILFSPLTSALFFAIGFWLLYVAAQRGNPASAGIFLVVGVMQLAVLFIAWGVANMRSSAVDQKLGLGSAALPVVVLLTMAHSRNILVELQKRDLWKQVYGACKPSGGWCVAGGVFLVAAVVYLYGGGILFLHHTQQLNVRVHQQMQAFADLLQHEEKELLTAITNPPASSATHGLDESRVALQALEAKLQQVREQTASHQRLGLVVRQYAQAVACWRAGLDQLKQPGGDPKAAAAQLQQGDEQRGKAVQAFLALVKEMQPPSSKP